MTTQWRASSPTSRRDTWRSGLWVLCRLLLAVAALFAAYFLIPARPDEGLGLPWLTLQLCVFGAVVGVQVPAIVRARYPILRAVESLGILVPLYLLIFARVYLSNSLNDPSGFSHALDHTTALYFTVTVFATVGFGDIVAQSDTMRLLVTLQMLLNLVVIGVVIRLLTSAARRGVALRGDGVDVGERDRPVD